MDDVPTILSDEQIVLLIQQGDKEKFGILMARYEKKLFRYGQKFLSGKENIEDIVQDVFISTFKNIQNVDTSLKFSSWIYRIAHNAFVNAIRKGIRNPLNFFDFDTLLSHPVLENPVLKDQEDQETKKLISRGLDALPAKYKEILILHYLEDLSYKEISDILQIPIGTVGVRIKRARDSLKKVYEKMDIPYEQQ